MSVFDHKILDSCNAKSISQMQFIEAELKRLKDEVDRLLKLRDILGNELALLEKDIVENAPIRIATNADEVVVDYADNGFAGEKVKKAVNAVRAVFFDDTLDAFKDFACSMVEERDTVNCIGLEFLFESLNNKDRGFTLFIPVSVARSHFEPELNEDMCADVNMEMRIKVGVDEKDSCVFLPKVSTLSYYEMAKAINEYVVGHDDKKSINNKAEICNYANELLTKIEKQQ